MNTEKRAIDWDAIHWRLESAAAAGSEGLRRDPEETRRVLRERALAAAIPAARPDETERLELLVFFLGGETYGIETRHVGEVCHLKDLTAIPCTPPFVAGVMNLRGRILAIVDLSKLFELPARGLTELNRVIVLGEGDDELGLLADSIEGVRAVAASDLREGLPTLTAVRERFLKGVAGQGLVVLDGGRLLVDDVLRVNEQGNR
ncbi:MAG TPA: chemotaxis protein CheW [bacterium]|nr:chemotaxis protein CheW [bacterium]